MVTKRQQLEWMSKAHKEWPFILDYICMSNESVGDVSYAAGSHRIAKQEWQQERDKMQKKAEQVAQPAPDNSWHERGELPPVGCVCEVKTKTFNDWMRCFVVGKSSRGDTVIECDDCAFIIDSSYELRPLRTEREKAIDEMVKLIGHGYMSAEMAKELAIKMYDSGYHR